MKLQPSQDEPANRRLTGRVRWIPRLRLGLGVAYVTPWYVYWRLAGVNWDCPLCKAESVVELRRRTGGHWFYCTACHSRLYWFFTPAAKALAAALRAKQSSET